PVQSWTRSMPNSLLNKRVALEHVEMPQLLRMPAAAPERWRDHRAQIDPVHNCPWAAGWPTMPAGACQRPASWKREMTIPKHRPDLYPPAQRFEFGRHHLIREEARAP